MAVESTMLPLGTRAPGFALPDLEGRIVSLDDFRDARALLVLFVCNHCPYVKLMEAEIGRIAAAYEARGLATVAIMPNDVARYPDDGPAGMRAQAERAGWRFPYLIDQTQDVARAYSAACTPDPYLFDGDRRLVYRGRIDDARPSNGIAPSGRELRAAIDAALTGAHLAAEQVPSIGCGIKWKS